MDKENLKARSAEAAKFLELTKTILTVPKKEVDAERVKYEQKKEREKRKRTK